MDRKDELVPIHIFGKKYEVPGSLTIQKAMEYAGFRFVRNCGCRGGVCGACVAEYRVPKSYKTQTVLACQKVVEPNMNLTQTPFVPARKAIHEIDSKGTKPEQIQELYPEIFRCVSCNTCSKVCPMDIDVMDYICAAIQGDIEKTAQISFECVMCGACAMRCPAEISQLNVAILARRLYGSQILAFPQDLKARLKEMREGKYEDLLDKLTKLDTNQLKEIYLQREQELGEARGWQPNKREFPADVLK